MGEFKVLDHPDEHFKRLTLTTLWIEAPFADNCSRKSLIFSLCFLNCLMSNYFFVLNYCAPCVNMELCSLVAMSTSCGGTQSLLPSYQNMLLAK